MPNITECKIDANGNKFWYLNNKRHREDGPAVEYSNGDKSWFLNGKLHREDGPAVEYVNGSKFWYLNGKLHREDINPETGLTCHAVEYANGNKYWFLNNKYHREDGPACEWADDGRTYYYINNKHIPQLDNKRIYGKENLQKYLILI